MGLQGRELSANITNYLDESGQIPALIADLLKHLSEQEPRGTAARILEQIRSDLDEDPGNYRKPVHYIAGSADGLAIAIVIDDRFWTSGW